MAHVNLNLITAVSNDSRYTAVEIWRDQMETGTIAAAYNFTPAAGADVVEQAIAASNEVAGMALNSEKVVIAAAAIIYFANQMDETGEGVTYDALRAKILGHKGFASLVANAQGTFSDVMFKRAFAYAMATEFASAKQRVTLRPQPVAGVLAKQSAWEGVTLNAAGFKAVYAKLKPEIDAANAKHKAGKRKPAQGNKAPRDDDDADAAAMRSKVETAQAENKALAQANTNLMTTHKARQADEQRVNVMALDGIAACQNPTLTDTMKLAKAVEVLTSIADLTAQAAND